MDRLDENALSCSSGLPDPEKENVDDFSVDMDSNKENDFSEVDCDNLLSDHHSLSLPKKSVSREGPNHHGFGSTSSNKRKRKIRTKPSASSAPKISATANLALLACWSATFEDIM